MSGGGRLGNHGSAGQYAAGLHYCVAQRAFRGVVVVVVEWDGGRDVLEGGEGGGGLDSPGFRATDPGMEGSSGSGTGGGGGLAGTPLLLGSPYGSRRRRAGKF